MSDVRLVDYLDTWPSLYAQVEGEIRSAVPAPGVVLEHIGSTAVHGLCAKPVLDVALGVPSLDDLQAWIPALAGIGFVYRPAYEEHVPDRRYFVRSAGHTPRVHLPAVVLGDTLWRQHLRFRDVLRRDAAQRQAYADLKKQLALRHASDKAAYTDAKAPFIQQLLATHGAVTP